MVRPAFTTPHAEAYMADMYAAGSSIAAISGYFECSEGVVRRALVRRGVAIRPRGRPAQVELTPDAVPEYEEGAPLSKLAERLAIPRTTLRRALERAGRYAKKYRRQ